MMARMGLLQWTVATGFLLIVQHSGSASDNPIINVQSVGDTWVILAISPAPGHSASEVVKYELVYGTGIDDRTGRDVHRRMGTNMTMVTLGGLEPLTKYVVMVSSVYADGRRGEHETVFLRTRYPSPEGMGKEEKHEVMLLAAAGRAVTYYFVIGLHVVISCIMAAAT